MRRTLLLSVLSSLVFVAVGSGAPPSTAAASSKVVISLPTRVTRDRLTSAHISLPGSVAAVDGRVLVSSRAAEVIGVAVGRKAVSLMPVAIKGGYAYGAYGLTATRGRTYLDVVLLPHKSGRIGIKVTIDSMADAKGRRIRSSGLSASRTLGVADASQLGGTRRGSRVYGTGSGSATFRIPAASGSVSPDREARGLRSLAGRKTISKRDQDYARQAWTQARLRGRVCDTSTALDPNGDGCADIVDLEATLAADGRTAGMTAISPVAPVRRPAPTSKPTNVKHPNTDAVDHPTDTERPATTEEPPAGEEPTSSGTPGDTATPPDAEADTSAGTEDSSGPGAKGKGARGKSAHGKSAHGKSARPATRADVTTSEGAGRTFTVTSTADTPDAARGDGVCADANGHCTLRAALGEADYLKGDDRIEFDLSGTAPVTIQITSRLPYITSRSGTLYIDGYSQPGSSVNTAEFGSNAVPGVEIRGNGSSAREVGLVINSPGNTVRGLLMDNLYRGIMLDGVDAHDNRIIGNLIGFTKSGANAAKQNFAVVLNTGASDNVVGAPTLANRNVIGNYAHAIENFGAGVDGNVIQNNVLCIRPGGGTAPCSTGIDHNFGPKNDVIGGDGQYERNVIGPTTLQGIEFSHGWDPALPPRVDTSSTYQITGNSVIGNWVGFRMDGSYSAAYRSGLNSSSADNGQGINVYDGSYDNKVLRNYVAATYDGIQVMAPNATGNVIKGNTIGEAPNGDAAPLTGWGIKLRWAAKYETIANNTIRNAELGGIGLVQNTVYNVRISRNIVTDTDGPAIYLAPTSGSTTKGANNLQAAPAISAATTTRVSGTGVKGALVEVYRADRGVGQQGLPIDFLGDTTVASNGSWHLDISGVDAGKRVTALQIRTDDNTSALAPNVALTEGAQPPASGDVIVSDDFGRSLSGGWGSADQGGAWSLTGAVADFSVNGASGQIRAAAAAAREARVGVPSTPDVAVTGTLSLDKVPSGTNAYAYVLARANGTNAYRAAIRVATNGHVYVQLKRAIGNAESNIAAEVAVPGFNLTPDGPIGFRFRVVGSDLRLRVWSATDAEPSDWTTAGTDTTSFLQGAGSVGLRTYFGSATSNGPLTVTLDDVRVRIP